VSSTTNAAAISTSSGSVSAFTCGAVFTSSLVSTARTCCPLPRGIPRRRRIASSTAAVAPASPPGGGGDRADKVVWIETTNVQVLLAALEMGLTTTALFSRRNAPLAKKWNKVGRFTALQVGDHGVILAASDGGSTAAIGILCAVEGPEDVADIAKLAGVEPLVIMDSSAWQAGRASCARGRWVYTSVRVHWCPLGGTL